MTERRRIEAVLRGERPDLTPWATRLDLWLNSRARSASLPPELAGLDTMGVYRALGVGRQSYVDVFKLRLRGVELVGELNGRRFTSVSSPVVKFPLITDLVPRTQAGSTAFTFSTPAGSIGMGFRTNATILATATLPYMERHPVTSDEDARVVAWILDHCEVLADYGPFVAREAEIGEQGLTIATMDRVPFQRLLLDFMGEETTFYTMHDEPALFDSLLRRVEEVARETLKVGLASPALMIELTDNYDGEITNPRLFARYCLPFMQEAREKAHAAGKVLGSHTDGDMSSLVELLAEGALDVAESFSPEPLSRLTFRRAWQAWRGKVIPWGCLASPLFEPGTTDARFDAEVRDVVEAARAGGGLILGIADQAVEPTLTSRVRRVRELLGD